MAATTDAETVWLKDVTTRIQTDKREVNGADLPDQLTFHLKRRNQDLVLNLKRNYHIDPNADIYIVQTLNDGRTILEKSQNLETKQDKLIWTIFITHTICCSIS
ncbi:hypothetical protein ACJMK2_007654 [Sinanodonta woodiana]|uniref:Ubiquitin-like domain-containing protein n=1 Tax=Sinanodonta woodiana TaxID=1069815 RepID=A0ABD3VJ66_SINWO